MSRVAARSRVQASMDCSCLPTMQRRLRRRSIRCARTMTCAPGLARRLGKSLPPNIPVRGLVGRLRHSIPACWTRPRRRNCKSLRPRNIAILLLAVSFLAAAAISYGLLVLLHPLLARHALAKPNARSSHKHPTPQGGGIAVVGVTVIVSLAAVAFAGTQAAELPRLSIVFAAAVGLAIVGAIDDLRPLEPFPRLALQIAAVAAVIATLPAESKAVPFLSWWFDRAILLVG